MKFVSEIIPVEAQQFKDEMRRVESREALLEEFGKEGSLASAEMRFLDLSGLDFSGLNLRHANLSASLLDGAVFDGSDLTHLFVQDSMFNGVSMRNTNMDHAFFQRVEMVDAVLTGVNGPEMSIHLSNLQRADFSGSKLDQSHFLGTNLDGSIFSEASLQGVCLKESSITGVKFHGCDMRGVDLRKVNLHQAIYENCQTEGAIFYGKSPWAGEASAEKNLREKMLTFDGE
ncbi:MAG: pentapeptide repeat-containing protein [Magnetococcales bacterium]|nr:pentapeptide repeat-containing protein [Magnetococcales bacterium]